MLACQLEHIPGADGTGVQSLDRIVQVVNRARERCQMEYPIYSALDGERLTDILFNKLEAGVRPSDAPYFRYVPLSGYRARQLDVLPE